MKVVGCRLELRGDDFLSPVSQTHSPHKALISTRYEFPDSPFSSDSEVGRFHLFQPDNLLLLQVISDRSVSDSNRLSFITLS